MHAARGGSHRTAVDARGLVDSALRDDAATEQLLEPLLAPHVARRILAHDGSRGRHLHVEPAGR